MYSINYNKTNCLLDMSHLKIIYICKGIGKVKLNNQSIEVKKGTYIRVNKGVSLNIDCELDFYIMYIFPDHLNKYFDFLETIDSKSFSIIRSEVLYLDYSFYYLNSLQENHINTYLNFFKNLKVKSPLIIMFFFNFSFQLSLLEFRTLGDNIEVFKNNTLKSNINLEKQRANSSIEDKVNKGLWLLETTDYKIKYISEICGIGSDSYFVYLVKKKIGVTPQKYRDSLKSISSL